MRGSVCCSDEVVASDVEPAQAAFARHVEPEIDTLYRVALTLTRHPADAEDLVQEALLRAFRSICQFDGRYPRAWLLTILRNTHFSRLRKKRPEILDDPSDGYLSRHGRDDPANEPEAILVDLTLDDSLAAALDDLSSNQRQVVEFVDVNGLSYQEAADALGVPIGTIMSRLHRARARLRGALEGTSMERA